MEYDNLFDRHLESRKTPEPFRSAAVDVTETLDLAWDAVRSVFGDQGTPEHAIAVTELMLRAARRFEPADGPGMP
jgi:hypothetical protein